MRSVLGKLICKELGTKKYKQYVQCLKEEQTTEVFCDLYYELKEKDRMKQAEMLLHLFDTVHLSIEINKYFLLSIVCYVAAIFILILLLPLNMILYLAITVSTLCLLYKVAEYVINRTCDVDIRMILIYKCVLFHLIEKGTMD